MRKIFLVLASIAVASTASVSLAGQSQSAPNQNPDIEAQRKLIREVADSLRKRDAAAGKPAVPKNWKASRTPWGDPDLTGVYTNSDESGIPFEKPAEFGGRRIEDITAADRLIVTSPTTTGLIVIRALTPEPGWTPAARSSLAAARCRPQ